MTQGNTVTIVGNLTRDPELRYTPTGAAQCTFGVAVNRVWTDKQTNERKEAVAFFNVVTWREMAENCGECLTKGMRVIVTGRLEQRSWETAEGDKRSTVEIVADEVGPSIRWATAEVTKNERKEGDFARAGAPSSSNGSGGSFDAPPAYDEEPF
jgi:single-strand DNA-binding protein